MDRTAEDRRRPTLAVVAGPNGSGKTSFYEQFLRQQFPRWVNADEIAKTLTDVAESKRDLAAAQLGEEVSALLSPSRLFSVERTIGWVFSAERRSLNTAWSSSFYAQVTL